ncbi:MAG: 30S ribosomal protein S27ae [archaeon]
MGKQKKSVKKGKKAKKKKVRNKLSTAYKISGDTIEKANKKCPKCSVFMANHKDRWSCGKCGYMEKK